MTILVSLNLKFTCNPIDSGGPGAHYQEVQKSADPNLRCRCGKQFKSIRWLEWHKENKCSVIDKNAKLEEFRQKVEQLQVK